MNKFEIEIKHSLEFYEKKRLILWDRPEDRRGRFQIKKKLLPDYWVFTYRGKFVLIECKSITKERWPFQNISKEQIRNLKRVKGWKGKSYIILNFRIKEKRINEAYQIPIEKFLKLKEKKMKSFELDFVRSKFIEIPGLKILHKTKKTKKRKSRIIKRNCWNLKYLLELTKLYEE